MHPTLDGERAGPQPEQVAGMKKIEERLRTYESAERERLGLEPGPMPQWTETAHNRFTPEQRPHTTILMAGLTRAHDEFVTATFRRYGYKSLRLDTPDIQALQVGKEFGSRGQCNPTYFTTGNLVKYLRHLVSQGETPREIIDNYLFITANGCGPCRFSTYLTEYRKALRDSGFDGFRVLLFSQTGGGMESTEEKGLDITLPMLVTGLKAVMCADIINLLGYRIRPYEVEPGTTDAAIERCKRIVIEALEQRRALLPAMWRVRRTLTAVRVDRTRIKPRVCLIGEIWAMTTEGDGNYRMQRFLEEEGAEVVIQPLIGWMITILWEYRFDTRMRQSLKGTDAFGAGLRDAKPRKGLFIAWLAEKLVRGHLYVFTRVAGLKRHGLPDMDKLAKLAHPYFDANQRGGEMFVEVGKVLENASKKKVNLTISVKPFGCMPSSGVSDGVQSLLTERHPQSLFLSLETTGDSAVNAYSRVQMQLFKARRQAEVQMEQALAHYDLSKEQAMTRLGKGGRYANSFHYPAQRAGSTGADLIHELGRRKWAGLRRPLLATKRALVGG